jgi:hypothetical protein
MRGSIIVLTVQLSDKDGKSHCFYTQWQHQRVARRALPRLNGATSTELKFIARTTTESPVFMRHSVAVDAMVDLQVPLDAVVCALEIDMKPGQQIVHASMGWLMVSLDSG